MSSPAGTPPRSWSPSTAVRRAIAGERIDLATLLRRRVVFVAGKGGTGRSTITASLALLAAKAGKRVLAIDVDAKRRPRRCARLAAVGIRAASGAAQPLGPRTAHRRVIPGIPEHLFQGAAPHEADTARARVRLHRNRRSRTARHARRRQDRLRGAAQGGRRRAAGVGPHPRRLRSGRPGRIASRLRESDADARARAA